MALKRTDTRVSKTAAFFTILVIAIFVVWFLIAERQSAERHYRNNHAAPNSLETSRE